MLTADLVRAQVREGALRLTTMKPPARKEAVLLATEYLELAHGMIGEPREALLDAWKSVDVRLRLEKVALGLQKLILDGCELEPEGALDPVALRREVFERATELRKEAEGMEDFDRGLALAEAASRHGVEASEIERLLFGDLRAAHRLLRAPEFTGEGLVHAYELGQEQAVLLRAERVVVSVTCRSPNAYRALFRRLKFLRLLATIDPIPSGGYRLTIDGPYSLFASTTKYGLELAMLLPLLRECDRFELTALVRWGAEKLPVTFEVSGTLGGGSVAPAPLPEELDTLVRGFRAKHEDWTVAPSDTLVDVRGHAVLVPDLEFTHVASGEVVLMELLGHWSRDAVWKRVELAPRLPTPMIFAIPSRLRVSEDVLPDDLPACLYAFKTSMRPGAVHERLEGLRSALRKGPGTP